MTRDNGCSVERYGRPDRRVGMSIRLQTGWVLLALSAVLGCSRSEASAERRQALPTDETPEVQRGHLTTRVLLSGELVAEDAELVVAPNVDLWPVQIRWLAEDGIEVSRGDRIVEFDSSQLAADLEQMHTQVLEAMNRLASLQAEAAGQEATSAFDIERRRAAVAKARLEAMVPEEIYSAVEFNKLQLDWRKAELELAEAEAKLEATREAKRAEIEIQRIALAKAVTDVSRAEARLDQMVLRASRDGILILADNTQEGRLFQVGDGAFPGYVIARLPDLASMYVSARLFDVDDGRIRPGMSVAATLDAFPDLKFSGRVREIDQIADQANSRSLRRFFRTLVDLDRIDAERMRPGMSVKVVIEDVYEDVLLAPRGSLDWTATGPRALLSDGSWARVSLGACDAMACLVTDGLDEATSLGWVARSKDRG